MISQTKKTTILEMLAKNKYSLRKIAMVVGTSWGTVKTIRDEGGKTKEWDSLPMVLRRKAKPRICPDCNAHVAIWPCIKCNPDHFSDHIVLRPDIYKDMSTTLEAKKQLPALLCLANDLQELAALNQINHILFSGLVDRARTIYNSILKSRKINDKT
jgi:hypothetical protein